jgi:hypothetical protein
VRLPSAIERELQRVEADGASYGGQHAGTPRFRDLRDAIATALAAQPDLTALRAAVAAWQGLVTRATLDQGPWLPQVLEPLDPAEQAVLAAARELAKEQP